jgi:hypothetical protein
MEQECSKHRWPKIGCPSGRDKKGVSCRVIYFMSLLHGVVVVTWRGYESGLGVGDELERKREREGSPNLCKI